MRDFVTLITRPSFFGLSKLLTQSDKRDSLSIGILIEYWDLIYSIIFSNAYLNLKKSRLWLICTCLKSI